MQNSLTKFILGGAQLGIPNYGISNKDIYDAFYIEQLIKVAYEKGISSIDIAMDYGEVQKLIGNLLKENKYNNLKIINKFTSKDLPKNADDIEGYFHKYTMQSLNLLQKNLDCLLLHRAKHLTEYDGKIWKLLKNLKDNKIVQDIGISVQTPEELCTALAIEEISVIQMPFNILDRRWDDLIEEICEQKKNRNLKIHVRSIFLQGLLITDDLKLWESANSTNSLEVIDWLKTKAKELKRESVKDMCLNFVKSQQWIDGIIIGVNNIAQLNENIMLFKNKRFSKLEIKNIELSSPKVLEKTLNPFYWKKND